MSSIAPSNFSDVLKEFVGLEELPPPKWVETKDLQDCYFGLSQKKIEELPSNHCITPQAFALVPQRFAVSNLVQGPRGGRIQMRQYEDLNHSAASYDAIALSQPIDLFVEPSKEGRVIRKYQSTPEVRRGSPNRSPEGVFYTVVKTKSMIEWKGPSTQTEKGKTPVLYRGREGIAYDSKQLEDTILRSQPKPPSTFSLKKLFKRITNHLFRYGVQAAAVST